MCLDEIYSMIVEDLPSQVIGYCAVRKIRDADGFIPGVYKSLYGFEDVASWAVKYRIGQKGYAHGPHLFGFHVFEKLEDLKGWLKWSKPTYEHEKGDIVLVMAELEKLESFGIIRYYDYWNRNRERFGRAYTGRERTLIEEVK